MLPQIIQGGMGVYVSTPRLANVTSRFGALGTVSSVAANIMLARVLQAGDPDGQYRNALSHFPFPDIVRDVLEKYFVADGIAGSTRYKSVPAITLEPTRQSVALHVCACFAFVWLAKDGHANPVSINGLEKMQMHHLYSIAGAMLAGVDVVTMGAGIPLQIPAVLDAFANGQAAEYRVAITGTAGGTQTMRFDPREFFGPSWPEELHRPAFLPIVSSDALATLMMKKALGSIEGFVVEASSAGGHNAPPRGKLVLNKSGEPVYGPRDQPDFAAIRKLGVPFWVAGAQASPQGMAYSKEVGAHGIQVGSPFALCEESGLSPLHREAIINRWHDGTLVIRKSATASPTGFPFQVVQLAGTLSDPDVYRDRKRMCSQHGLSMPHRLESGEIVYRCPAEPPLEYDRKGGESQDTIHAVCLCNGLIAATGYGDPDEPAIVTLGDDTSFLAHLTDDRKRTYTAAEAMQYLRGPVRTP